MALSPVTASRTTRLEVAPGPSFAASTLCIVQISVLLGRLVSIRAGFSQARVGMECPGSGAEERRIRDPNPWACAGRTGLFVCLLPGALPHSSLPLSPRLSPRISTQLLYL